MLRIARLSLCASYTRPGRAQVCSIRSPPPTPHLTPCPSAPTTQWCRAHRLAAFPAARLIQCCSISLFAAHSTSGSQDTHKARCSTKVSLRRDDVHDVRLFRPSFLYNVLGYLSHRSCLGSSHPSTFSLALPSSTLLLACRPHRTELDASFSHAYSYPSVLIKRASNRPPASSVSSPSLLAPSRAP